MGGLERESTVFFCFFFWLEDKTHNIEYMNMVSDTSL